MSINNLEDNAVASEDPVAELNQQMQERRHKLQELREAGNAYPNSFKPKDKAEDILAEYDAKDNAELETLNKSVTVAGRIMLRRIMGKASFVHIQDLTGKIQLYLKQNELPEGVYAAFKHWDIGDIIGASGIVFKTKTGELSIKVNQLELITKSLRPLPDKWHGLENQELKYRKRYVDLIVNAKTREVFRQRSKAVAWIRNYLDALDFMEVETPMMQPIPGGATARPFITHHNALDRDLYLRVSPELYLKRLVVGGFERVYEINKNFRNEGLSTRHNPEFTMIEFYQAYATYQDLISLTADMLQKLVVAVTGGTTINYQEMSIDFAQFKQQTLTEALLEYNSDLDASTVADKQKLTAKLKELKVKIPDGIGLGGLQFLLFEYTAEDKLIQPTFITELPTEVSPLARQNDINPEITDRFELYIAGREIANAFSELNDPEEQAARFRQQVEAKDAGDHEAMHFDADYIEALEYGMPYAAGCGIGIDRLVMLLTNSSCIRDVLLFPQLKS